MASRQDRQLEDSGPRSPACRSAWRPSRPFTKPTLRLKRREGWVALAAALSRLQRGPREPRGRGAAMICSSPKSAHRRGSSHPCRLEIEIYRAPTRRWRADARKWATGPREPTHPVL